MKYKFGFVLIMLSSAFTIAFTQNLERPSNRLSVGVGFGSVPDFNGIFDSNTEIYLSPVSDYYFTYKSTGPTIGLMYDHNIIAGLYLGWSFTYQYIKYGTYTSNADVNIEPGTYVGSAGANHYSVLARISYNYSNVGITRIYSGVELGVSILNVYSKKAELNKSNINFAYQINVFGLSVGNKVAFFFEAGYGYRGILHGGVMFNF